MSGDNGQNEEKEGLSKIVKSDLNLKSKATMLCTYNFHDDCEFVKEFQETDDFRLEFS